MSSAGGSKKSKLLVASLGTVIPSWAPQIHNIKKSVLYTQYMQICVMCNDSFDPQSLTLEQKIIEDGDFCTRCWTELMEIE